MTQTQKQEVRALLITYRDRYDSQAQAFRTIQGASEASLINIVKEKWSGISNELWRTVASQVGYSVKGQWQTVETKSYKVLTRLLQDAKDYSNVFAITAPAGSGKTQASKAFKRQNQNVFHIVCAEYFNRRSFLMKLLKQMGKDHSGSVNEMMDEVVEAMLELDSPIIIMDEADKLNDTVLYFFITLYNQLQGQCAMVLLATDYLSKRLMKGRRTKRKGYEEIFSRLGRKFIPLPENDRNDVTAICRENGIEDQETIMTIFNDCEGDLRRVERLVHREKMKAA